MTQQRAQILPFQNATEPSESVELMRKLLKGQEELGVRLDELRMRLDLSVVKETYSTKEVAERLDRKPWTVRDWCNHGQAKAAKKPGKGRTDKWRIPHDELIRLQNEGPMPVGTFDNGSCLRR